MHQPGVQGVSRVLVIKGTVSKGGTDIWEGLPCWHAKNSGVIWLDGKNKMPEGKDVTIVIFFFYVRYTQKTKQILENNLEQKQSLLSWWCVTMAHLDFGGSNAGAAFHPMESDGVELSLVQIHHGELAGLVRRSCRSPKRKLELTPGSLRWGTGVGAGVDGAGMVFREGVAVGKILIATQRYMD